MTTKAEREAGKIAKKALEVKMTETERVKLFTFWNEQRVVLRAKRENVTLGKSVLRRFGKS